MDLAFQLRAEVQSDLIDKDAIRAKFGADYDACDLTFKMGIDTRFANYTGSDHAYRFLDSTTRPPSDWLMDHLADYTENITLVQPPLIDEREFDHLLPHEMEKLYISGNHELYCLHFGSLRRTAGNTEFRIE